MAEWVLDSVRGLPAELAVFVGDGIDAQELEGLNELEIVALVTYPLGG
jgi:hypothetical protein